MTSQQPRKLLLLAVLGLALLPASACMTFIVGSQDEVEISSDPPGALAIIQPSGQRVKTPAVVQLERSQVHTVWLYMPGYESTPMYIHREPNGLQWVSLALTSPLGMVVDHQNGATFSLGPQRLHKVLKRRGDAQ